MTRKKYVFVLPIMIVGGLVLGFFFSVVFPHLPSYSTLVFVAGAGAVIVIVDRVLRVRVDEPLNDERIQGIYEKAAWISYRISTIVLMVAGIAFTLIPVGQEGFRLIGIGACVSAALQALVFSFAWLGLRGRRL